MSRSAKVALHSFVLVTLALASCSSGGAPTPAARAETACRAVDAAHYYSSEPGTLGEARSWTIGTGVQPLETALPDSSGSRFIAWCWFNSGGFYTSMIADENGHSVSTGSTSNSPPPPGPPDIP